MPMQTFWILLKGGFLQPWDEDGVMVQSSIVKGKRGNLPAGCGSTGLWAAKQGRLGTGGGTQSVFYEFNLSTIDTKC